MNSRRRQLALSAVALLAGATAAGHAQADLIINVTRGGTGNAVIELIGTGAITANGGSGSLINVVTTGDTFIADGFAGTSDDRVTPTIGLGAATTRRVFILDLGGNFEQGNNNVHSRIGFGGFTGDFVTGDDASDLNGTYNTDLPMSAFVNGTYNPVLGFTADSRSMTDIGTITMNVVPEPASAALLGVGWLLFFRRRR